MGNLMGVAAAGAAHQPVQAFPARIRIGKNAEYSGFVGGHAWHAAVADRDVARAAAAAAGAAGAAAGVEAGAEHAAASAPSRPAVKLPKWHAAAEQWMDDGVSFLLNTERKFGCKGSWVSDATAFYTRYHAAYCGIVGLLELGDATARPPQSARAEGGDAEHEAEGAVPPQLCSYIVPRPFVVADMSTALAPPVSLERLVATMSG